MFDGQNEIDAVLNALSEQLKAKGAGTIEMVVCGGAALNILGFVSRPTEDVDVIAFVKQNKELIKARPLLPELVEAAKRVREDFNLTDNWLNAGPADVMDLGLPDGLMNRVETRKYGKALTIHFLSRYDQIYFKLYAVIDQGYGRHYDDLMELNPTANELESAARWSMTHDTSEEFRQVLIDFLKQIGQKDEAARI